jgi:hypothetical protein
MQIFSELREVNYNQLQSITINYKKMTVNDYLMTPVKYCCAISRGKPQMKTRNFFIANPEKINF